MQSATPDDVARLRWVISTMRWQASAYLTRVMAEIPDGEARWLAESALNHVIDTANTTLGDSAAAARVSNHPATWVPGTGSAST